MKNVQLTNSSLVTIVDDGDYERVKTFSSWHLCRGHARSGKHPQVYLHHFVFGFPGKGKEVDHRDNNFLNNQKKNLRWATHSQNNQNKKKYRTNRSGFKGVSWALRNKKWQAQIQVGGVHYHLGFYDTPIGAARMYDSAARKLHGKFARTNFPMRFPRLDTEVK